jgi:hypothetical protein
MNDFTKEELEEIAFNLGEIRVWSETLESSWPVLDKLQSMIDNYCEHHWQESIHDSDLYLCIKCSKRIHFTEFKNDD